MGLLTIALADRETTSSDYSVLAQPSFPSPSTFTLASFLWSPDLVLQGCLFSQLVAFQSRRFLRQGVTAFRGQVPTDRDDSIVKYSPLPEVQKCLCPPENHLTPWDLSNLFILIMPNLSGGRTWVPPQAHVEITYDTRTDPESVESVGGYCQAPDPGVTCPQPASYCMIWLQGPRPQ